MVTPVNEINCVTARTCTATKCTVDSEMGLARRRGACCRVSLARSTWTWKNGVPNRLVYLLSRQLHDQWFLLWSLLEKWCGNCVWNSIVFETYLVVTYPDDVQSLRRDTPRRRAPEIESQSQWCNLKIRIAVSAWFQWMAQTSNLKVDQRP